MGGCPRIGFLALGISVLFGGGELCAQTVNAGFSGGTGGRPGDDFVQVLRLRLNVPAATTLTSLAVSSLNTADADAAVVSAYYTGSSPTFSSTTKFGDVNAFFAQPDVAAGPFSFTGATGGWTSPLNAQANDAAAATTGAAASALTANTFNVSIPADAQIAGIVVQTDAWRVGGGANTATLGIRISGYQSNPWSNELATVPLTTTEATQSVGSPTDISVWGLFEGSTEVPVGQTIGHWALGNGTGPNHFRFRVEAISRKTGGGAVGTFNLDWLRVLVYYRVPSATGGTATFRGSQALAIGDNYLHVVYAVSEGAPLGNILDAQIPANGLTIGGSTYPAVAISPAGEKHVLPGSGVLLADRLEPPLAGYTFTTVSDVCATTHPWASSTADPRSPVTNWLYPSNECQVANGTTCSTWFEPGPSTAEYLLGTPAVAVPAGTTGLGLTFWHKLVTEATYDGGAVQYQINAGVWTNIPPARLQRNAYNTSCGTLGADCWNGDLYAGRYVKVTADLAGLSIEGNTLKIRWRAKQDSCTTWEGWKIDDITIKGTPACAEPLADSTNDLNGTAAASKVCVLPFGTTVSGLEASATDTTDFWFLEVLTNRSYKLDMDITSAAQFDLYVYQKDGSTVIVSDAPGAGGTVGPGAAIDRTVTTPVLAPGVYFVEARYISGTSSYTLTAEPLTPLDASLSGFRADRVEPGVRISWDADATSNALSFRLIREDGDGGQQVVGPDPILVHESPATYSELDSSVSCEGDVAYTLEETALNGEVTSHGPISPAPCAAASDGGAPGGCACATPGTSSAGGGAAAALSSALVAIHAARRRKRLASTP